MKIKNKIIIFILCIALIGITLFYPLTNASSTYQWRDNTNQYQEQFDNDPSQPDTIPPYVIPDVVVPDVDERDTRYDGMYNIDIEYISEEIPTYLHLDRQNGKMMFIFQFDTVSDMSLYDIYFLNDRNFQIIRPGMNRNQASQIGFDVFSIDDITYSAPSLQYIYYQIDLRAQENLPLPSKTTTTGYFYYDNVNYRVVLEWDIIQSNPIEEGMEWDITLFNYTLFSSYNQSYSMAYLLTVDYAIGGGNLYQDGLQLLLDFSPDFLHTYTQGYEAGYKLGYENGYKNGYHDSYLKVVNGGITSSWFTGLFDGIQGFLDIKFGQISIGAIILIPLSITIVWFIIRQFRGGGGGD